MDEIGSISLYCWIAGLAITIGALAGRMVRRHDSEGIREIIHTTIAFGGGILVAAVAFALVPTGMNMLPLWVAVPLFFVGSLLFMWIDQWLNRRSGSRAQFMAMLLDFVPEAVSLGAVFPHNPRLGVLLALFIGAQNLPEGFNAYRELIASKTHPRHILGMMLLLSLLGPMAGLLGYFLLQNQQGIVGGIMLTAGGGILYLVFQDIAPLIRMKRHWAPALGATLGFIVGMVGERLLG
jgi:ZIP family zinc transporter